MTEENKCEGACLFVVVVVVLRLTIDSYKAIETRRNITRRQVHDEQYQERGNRSRNT